MSAHSNGNNVYKPKLTGFLIAAIALVLLVIALLVSTILILSMSARNAGQTTPPDATTPPVVSGDTTTPTVTDDDPAQTTTTVSEDGPDEPITPDNDPPQPIDPNRTPTKVTPDEITLSLPASGVNEGSLLLLDETHPYTKDPALLISRTDMAKLSAEKLLEIYGFERIAGNTGNYSIKNANLFINSEALYYFNEMLEDYVKESGNTDVQIRNAYYCSGDPNDIESVEHSTGYYLDLQIYRSNGTYPLNYETLKADYYDWFVKNCWKYGYLHVRDIDNKYSSFRFVGAAHAAAMNKYSFNMTQYLSAISVYSYDTRMKVTDGFGWEWWVYYVRSVGGETSVRALGNENSYRISGNNTDGYVIAINSSCFS